MSVTQRLDRMQRRHPVLGFPLAVLYKFVDDQGSYLAALITYYGFLSLFPLLLLMTSVLGFVLGGDAHLQQRVLNSTLSQFPVIGSRLGDPKGLRGSGAGLVIGLLGAVYGGLGVGPGRAERDEHRLAHAAPQPSQPDQGPAAQPAAAGSRRPGRAGHHDPVRAGQQRRRRRYVYLGLAVCRPQVSLQSTIVPVK